MTGIAAKFIGVSPVTAISLQGDAKTTVATAGTTQATATALGEVINVVSTSTADQGVRLFANGAIIGDQQWVYNNTANQIKVYPPVGWKINQISANGSMTLAPSTSCMFIYVSSTLIVGNLSA